MKLIFSDRKDDNISRIGFGHRAIHLIDFHDIPDSEWTLKGLSLKWTVGALWFKWVLKLI